MGHFLYQRVMGGCQGNLTDGAWEGTPRSDAQLLTLEGHRHLCPEKMCSARSCAGLNCQALPYATVITSPWDSREGPRHRLRGLQRWEGLFPTTRPRDWRPAPCLAVSPAL